MHLGYRHRVHLMWVLRVEPEEPFEAQYTPVTTEPHLQSVLTVGFCFSIEMEFHCAAGWTQTSEFIHSSRLCALPSVFPSSVLGFQASAARSGGCTGDFLALPRARRHFLPRALPRQQFFLCFLSLCLLLSSSCCWHQLSQPVLGFFLLGR